MLDIFQCVKCKILQLTLIAQCESDVVVEAPTKGLLVSLCQKKTHGHDYSKQNRIN